MKLAFASLALLFGNLPGAGLHAQSPNVEPNPYFRSDLLRYVEDNLPVQSASQNRYEALCYEEMVLHARRLPADVLRRAASHQLTFAQMFGDDRARYRGALVHLEGRMRLLRRMELPATLIDLDRGLTNLYEAWLFTDAYGGNPYCIVFSELPDGLQPSETIDRLVSTDAFFFKRYRYSTKDGWRDAPLLIAKTVSAAPAPVAAGQPIWQTPAAVVAAVIVLIAAGLSVVVGLVWWFRRRDRQTRAAVDRALKSAERTASRTPPSEIDVRSAAEQIKMDF